MKNTFYIDVQANLRSSTISYIGYEDGERVHETVPFRPKLYVHCNEETTHKTITGENLQELEFDTFGEFYEFRKSYPGEVYGDIGFVEQFISQHYPDEIEFDPDVVNTMSIDIEVACDEGFPEPANAAWPINAITVKLKKEKTYHTFALGKYNPKKNAQNLRVNYREYTDERELLKDFVDWWKANKIDVVTGWNSRGFDIPYLVKRLSVLFGETSSTYINSVVKKLSPFRRVKYREYDTRFSSTKNIEYEIGGVLQLDYLEMFKKFADFFGPQDNYTLDNIASVVLKEKKLDYSEYGSLHDLYKHDFQKFIDYNIKDTWLVDRFDEELNLIELVFILTFGAKAPVMSAFGTTKIWDAYIYSYLGDKNIIIPPRKRKRKGGSIAGGFVKDPVPSVYNWVMSFDYASLYPHLMMHFNMSPETIADALYDIGPDHIVNKRDFYNTDLTKCISGSGQRFYINKRGFIPDIIEKSYNARKEVKRQMIQLKKDGGSQKEIIRLHNKQHAIKITINSLYGAMSNEFFRFFDDRIAEAITLSGQAAIRWAERAVNELMNKTLKTDKDYIIAIDTDSVYVNCESLVDKVVGLDAPTSKIVDFLDNTGEKIFEKMFEKSFVELQEYLNCPEQKLSMKREVIASKAIWTGKKRYVMNVWDDEGVRLEEPKIKMVGIEAVRSSTPHICRESIKDAIKVILNEDEAATQKFVSDFRKKFKDFKPEEVAFPRGVNDLENYSLGRNKYKKGTPVNAKAAIFYNYLLDKHDLKSKFNMIHSGDKIKWAYLKIPNPLHDEVIGFLNVLPEEFNLHDYIDYDLQFEKSFLSPIDNILKSAGWTAEPFNSLEDLFE